MSTTQTTDQLEFTEDELLADHDFAEPLIANGVRCHGGFDADGTYVSPRTLNRAPAIAAWEANRRARAGTDPLELPLDTWPANFPNIEQSKFLIAKGVPGPTISALTRIGTVEGFGAMLRYQTLPDFQGLFDDDIRGTATEHIRKGLFEAHARDEAGWEDEAGHDRMWFAARDIAFENPVTEDETALMLERLGIPRPGAGGKIDVKAIREAAIAMRVLPDDIDFDFESMLNRMITLLFIEIQAFHGFAWAEGVLSDPDVCAGDGEAARIISYVRADEAPHVAYLTLALSEMRDWTWRGANGTTYDGAEMIRLLWDKHLDQSRFLRRGDNLRMVLKEITHAIGDRPGHDDLLDELLALGTVQPLPGGGFVERTRTGEEVEVP
jgi:hypothetical protein